MVALLVILILIVGFLLWLVVAPFKLIIDTIEHDYRISIPGVFGLKIIPDEEQGSLKTLGTMALLPLSSAPLNRTLQSLRKVKHLAGILVGFLRSL